MIKCKLCPKEFEGGRGAHQHMLRVHPEEYRAADFDLEQLTEGYIRKKRKYNGSSKAPEKDPELSERPAGLRPLRKTDPDELEAYRLGYRYFDPESGLAFSIEEMQEEGWI